MRTTIVFSDSDGKSVRRKERANIGMLSTVGLLVF